MPNPAASQLSAIIEEPDAPPAPLPSARSAAAPPPPVVGATSRTSPLLDCSDAVALMPVSRHGNSPRRRAQQRTALPPQGDGTRAYARRLWRKLMYLSRGVKRPRSRARLLRI